MAKRWGGLAGILPDVAGQQTCSSNVRDDLSPNTRKDQIRYFY